MGLWRSTVICNLNVLFCVKNLLPFSRPTELIVNYFFNKQPEVSMHYNCVNISALRIFFRKRWCEAKPPEKSAKSQLFEFLFFKLRLLCLFKKWAVVSAIYWRRNRIFHSSTSISLSLTFLLYLRLYLHFPRHLYLSLHQKKITQKGEGHWTIGHALPIVNVIAYF